MKENEEKKQSTGNSIVNSIIRRERSWDFNGDSTNQQKITLQEVIKPCLRI